MGIQDDLKACPFCGAEAKRITPMGFWTPEGYSPNGVRYVCGRTCPGGNAFYGDDAEARAIAAWNTRCVKVE